MYKKVSILFVALVATVMLSYAQVYVGGSLGFNTSGGKFETTGAPAVDLPSTSSFHFSPRVGYYLDDNLSAGLMIGFGSDSRKDMVPGSGGSNLVEEKISTSSWSFAAFGRYKAWELKDFSLLLEGSLGVGGGTVDKVKGPTNHDGDKAFRFGLNVVPVLSYSITDKLSVEGQLNFLSFGFNTETITEKFPGTPATEDKTSTNRFGLGVNNAWQPFSWRVGFIFKLDL